MHELTANAKNISVLVVDDAPSMRSLLVAILKSFGISNVYEANDGVAALNVLNKRSVDLIFCDWEMPRKSGLELYEELKKDAGCTDTSFVLVTSMSELDNVKKAMSAGITHYIVKPFKEETLMSKINELFPVV